MTIKVAIAGATGWAGSALARAVLDASDLELVSAVGKVLGPEEPNGTAAAR